MPGESPWFRERLARTVALAWLAGKWRRPSLLRVAARLTPFQPKERSKLVDRILVRFPPSSPPPRFVALVAALVVDEVFLQRKAVKNRGPLPVTLTSPRMQPARAAQEWSVPALPTPKALADWLGVGLSTLDGWADPQGRLTTVPDGRRHHYQRYWVGERLVEAPKAQLAKMQRRILRGIIEAIPPHPAAHGFVRGRSIVTHARRHCGQPVVLRCDLRRFFVSVPRHRVQGIFRQAGYPEPVARLLASLCTTATPGWCLRAAPKPADKPILRQRHLPQGAPTSPALANLIAHRLDRRLTGLAVRFGVTYSRYADDLTFSGPERLRSSRWLHWIREIVEDEGFVLNESKTNVMGQAGRQRVTGLTVNERPNISRQEFERLKAILTNCVRHGPESQNRDQLEDFRGHLEGRVAFVSMVNPAKAMRLRRLLCGIEWSSGPTHDGHNSAPQDE